MEIRMCLLIRDFDLHRSTMINVIAHSNLSKLQEERVSGNLQYHNKALAIENNYAKVEEI